ncbi:apolipoprotein N-acyltransferase [Oxalobacteraceae bacterium GrIS 2.11]
MHSVLARCPSWALFLCAFVLGAINVFAFAPLSLWPLQLLGLSALFTLLYHSSSALRMMQLSWLYCAAWLFFGVTWLTVTMYRYGDMPVWLSFACVALFSGALALIPALLMGLAARLRTRYVLAPWMCCLVLFPTLWSLAEWTRGWIFTGFPWLVSGYAHNVSPLVGFAPIIGVYGISWLASMIAGCLVLILERQRVYALLIVGICIAGGALHFVSWTQPSGAPLTVRLLQGNIDQQVKFEREHLIDSLQFYHDAIMEKPADFIVSPESALPIIRQALPAGYLDGIQKFATETNSTVALGMFSNDGPDLYANSVISINPVPQKLEYRYDKHHLVPFGEFIPKGFAWFYAYMHIPMGDQQRGPLLASPFPVKDQQVLPNICYEDVFGEEIASRISYAYFAHKAVPTILLNMTNIAWFGDTWVMPQHVQITQMRTLETGRPMLRATNTGVTTLVDAQGRVVKQLASYVRGKLEVTVQGYQGLTPYIVCGNYLWLGLMSLFALIARIFPLRVKKSKS